MTLLPDPPFAVTNFHPERDGTGSGWVLHHGPSEVFAGSQGEAAEMLDGIVSGPPFFGYLGYELGEWTEEILSRPSCDWGIPDFWLARFQHSEPFQLPPPSQLSRSNEVIVSSTLSPAQHREGLDRIEDYLLRGDIYQANLTVRFEAAPVLDPWEYFLSVARLADAPYTAYFDSGDWKVISISPELFLDVRGRKVVTFPIKGTVGRGSNEAEDNAAIEWLRGSEKNIAELVMIVDLERNDLGRVCRTGSIRWGSFPESIALPAVHHLACRVEGVLEEEAGPRRIIEATFPGGSISGAPKRRALQILRELEPHRRGPYCGAIGYISADSLLLNVAIRTGVWKDGRLRFWGGGGIVVGHSVEEEQEEIRCKLDPFVRALGVPRSEFWR
jgi:anthranilate/para-aminobenzoate synthase component I